jgi:hypothetical protein
MPFLYQVTLLPGDANKVSRVGETEIWGLCGFVNTTRFKVIIESQPIAEGMVSLYVPELVKI